MRIDDLYNHNVFIAYRGYTPKNESKDFDSKYVGVLLYYELKKNKIIDPFFAPICYGQGDNFLEDIDRIMKTIDAAIIISSNNMFSKTVTVVDEKKVVNKNDPLYRELKAIFTSKQIMDKGKNVFIINTSSGYSLQNDPNFDFIYQNIINEAKDSGSFVPPNIDKIKGLITKNFEDNNKSLFIELSDRLLNCIMNNRNEKNNEYYTFKFSERLRKQGSATNAFEELINIIENTFLQTNNFLKDQYVKDFMSSIVSNDNPRRIDMNLFKKEVERWLCQVSEVGHMASINDLYHEHFSDNSPSLFDALSIEDDKKAYTSFREYFKKTYEDRKLVIQKQGELLLSSNPKKNNILVYSSSSSAANFVTGIYGLSASDYNLFISECRIKSGHPFVDALGFSSSIKSNINKIIITDNTALQLLQEKKIDKVVLGACFVNLKDNILKEIVNTSGSRLIVDIANRNDIPVFIVANKNKKIPQDGYSDTNRLEDTLVNGYVIREEADKDPEDFNYLAINDISSIKSGSNFIYFFEKDYEKFYRTGNIFYISDNDIDNKLFYDYFYNDIFKDHREITNIDNNRLAKKCNQSLQIEKDFFEFAGKLSCLPTIFGYSNDSIIMERINGVRIFELFVAFDELYRRGNLYAYNAKKVLLKRCENNQKLLSKKLTDWSKSKDLTPYPREKIVELIDCLYSSLLLYYSEKDFDLCREALRKDADAFYDEYVSFKSSFVPFRDSTIKNMILKNDNLYGYDHIETNEDLNKFVDLVEKELKTNPEFINENPIYDIDFSSIINSTSKYDDLIGLFLHERSYSIENETELLSDIKTLEEKNSFITALIVRYLRFAGRKRMYRLIAPSYHRVRFKYDNEKFYFNRMLDIVNKLDCHYFDKYETFYKFLQILANEDNVDQTFDLNKFYFEHHNLSANKPWIGTYGGVKK